MTGDGEAGGRKERGSALFKAMAVLEGVIRHNRPVGLPDLAVDLGLPRQTVHRVLQQLEAEGLLRRDLSRDRFFIGPRLTKLSLDALGAVSHTGPTRAILKALVGEIGETCNIGVLDGREVIYIEREECDWPLRPQLRAGSRVPVHCTSIGKLLLAHQTRSVRQRTVAAAPLDRYTEHTITDPGALEESFAEIRKAGYATNREEYNAGIVSLAVPIKNAEGRVVAGLAVHAPLVRMHLGTGLDYLPKLRDTAEQLAVAWGALDAPEAA